MSHPTIDGGHCSEPYLPTEPAELLQSGDYATEVDVLIGEGEGRDGATFVLILVHSAVKCFICFTIGFYNHGEGPY